QLEMNGALTILFVRLRDELSIHAIHGHGTPGHPGHVFLPLDKPLTIDIQLSLGRRERWFNHGQAVTPPHIGGRSASSCRKRTDPNTPEAPHDPGRSSLHNRYPPFQRTARRKPLEPLPSRHSNEQPCQASSFVTPLA